MAEIKLQQIAHSYHPDPASADDYALRPCDYFWEDGGAYALLGPSGCGKTTLLNIISGLLRPSEGRVLFNQEDVTARPTRDRNIAQVFQFPVIYDSMTIYDNLAFPLRNRRLPKSEVHRRVLEVAEMLELTPMLDARAGGLSADSKQTISLGRGLVRQDVAAILFDEPLTVIDPHMKLQLRRKLKQIHERYGLTLIYVTHDQNEALTFADRVVVMNEGEVLQVGTPQELFEKPAHTFVGHFIGSPGMNFLECELEKRKALVGGHYLELANAPAGASAVADGAKLIGIRPEYLQLSRSEAANSIPVTVDAVEDLGNYQLATTRVGANQVTVKLGEQEKAWAGPAYLHFPPESTQFYVDDRLVEPA